MFVTKKHLTRRTVLRGVGTALALPLLDAMIPARTALGADGGERDAAPGIHLLPAWRGAWPSGRLQAKARSPSSARS